MGKAVLRLHGSVGQHGGFIGGLNTTALCRADVARGLQRHGLVVRGLAQHVEDCIGIEVFIGAVIPRDLQRLAALHRRED